MPPLRLVSYEPRLQHRNGDDGGGDCCMKCEQHIFIRILVLTMFKIT